MVMSKFIGKIIHEQWEGGSHQVPENASNVEKTRFVGRVSGGGIYYDYTVFRYEKIDRVLMTECDIPVRFIQGSNVEIDGDIVVIEKIIYHLDGSVTYETDKVLERITVSSEEEAELKARIEAEQYNKKKQEQIDRELDDYKSNKKKQEQINQELELIKEQKSRHGWWW